MFSMKDVALQWKNGIKEWNYILFLNGLNYGGEKKSTGAAWIQSGTSKICVKKKKNLIFE